MNAATPSVASSSSPEGEDFPHLCQHDNWSESAIIDDPAPRAVRWATREMHRDFSPDWSKWHYSEGNGCFTACGQPVILFAVDGSPQERELPMINCRRCLAKMAAAGVSAESVQAS